MLNIPQETERLARLVAVRNGTTPEQVVSDAVAQQARTIGIAHERQPRSVDHARLDAITRRSASRPVLDGRSTKDILDDAWGDVSA